MGINVAITCDFHGDGHPQDLTDLRLQELEAYYRMCRRQSDSQFLLIPSEEANVILGGHWTVTFPKPVYWFMGKKTEGPLQRTHPEVRHRVSCRVGGRYSGDGAARARHHVPGAPAHEGLVRISRQGSRNELLPGSQLSSGQGGRRCRRTVRRSGREFAR